MWKITEVNKLQEKTERAFKGVWIPREIWLDEKLTWLEKIYLVEIDSLDNDDGCFAGNKYFSDFFKTSKSSCSNIINRLIDKGYLIAEYEKKGKSIIKRTLKVTDKFIRDTYTQKVYRVSTESVEGYTQIV